MSVIYKNVLTLESLSEQLRAAATPKDMHKLNKKYAVLRQQVEADINPLLDLCLPWKYVPANSLQ